MKWIEIEYHGRKHKIAALKSHGKLWFHWQGQTHVLDLEARRGAGAESSAGDPSVISAPMPGKVTRVDVKTGDEVKKGQALVVMEAMKMEYTLEAGCDGKVAEVRATAGAQVGLGDLLVRMEAL